MLLVLRKFNPSKNEIIIAGITQACGLTKKPSQQLTKENLKPKNRKIKDPLKKKKKKKQIR